IIDLRISGNSLRSKCKQKALRYYTKSTCGQPAEKALVPCITKDAKGRVKVAIRTENRCSAISLSSGCRGFSTFIATADTTNDGISDGIYSGPCSGQPTEAKDIFSTMSHVSGDISELVSTYGVDEARTILIDELRQETSVADAGVSEDSNTIWIRFSNGLS